jgi:hypothetical protein
LFTNLVLDMRIAPPWAIKAPPPDPRAFASCAALLLAKTEEEIMIVDAYV